MTNDALCSSCHSAAAVRQCAFRRILTPLDGGVKGGGEIFKIIIITNTIFLCFL